MKNKATLVILSFVIILIVGVLALFRPRTTTDLAGNPVTNPSQYFADTVPAGKNIDRPILITNGVKHNVPLENIQAGGPQKDGIPSIDEPKFIGVGDADEYMDDDGLGIAVSRDGVDRFYPNQILVWHEIVNDTINGKRVLITYCPLCGTGIVFDPIVNGTEVEFGTSGKLWNSNLIMYDRLTDTYWSQVLGQAIVGELTGERLRLVPYTNITYGDWKKEHPRGQVLSKDTGFIKNYNRDPYGDYYSIDNPRIFFPVDNRSDVYPEKAFVYGLEIHGRYKAYADEELKKITTYEDSFEGVAIHISYNPKNSTAVFTNARTGEEIVPVFGFWFSWFAVHPDTEVFIAP